MINYLQKRLFHPDTKTPFVNSLIRIAGDKQKNVISLNNGQAVKCLPTTIYVQLKSNEMYKEKITNVVIQDIDMKDYPDFVDATIASAEYDGREMTDDELDLLNEDRDFIMDKIQDQWWPDFVDATIASADFLQ